MMFADPRWELLLKIVTIASLFIVVLVGAVRHLCLARRSREWPAIDGTIDEHQTRRFYGLGEPYHQLWYTYEVDGLAYRNFQLSVDGMKETEREMMELFQRLPVGSVVKVYYDPVHPARSSLRVGPSGGGWLMLAGFSFLAILVLFAGFKDNAFARAASLFFP
jgi:hypothetical protein